MSARDAKLVEKVKALGEPRFSKEAPEDLDFDYLLKFCEVVAKHAKLVQEMEKGSMLDDRRKALKEKNDEKYKEILQRMMDMEQEIADKVLDLASKVIELSGSEIETQIEKHTQN
mmetsp:Transcript_3592/g.6103  ORF Transcript_3592/g.6103 Transcript_3592/m.6103 type:complete len:115 (-) Transcript_3592:559-903(-)